MPSDPQLLFHRWLKNPLGVGAIAPSSRDLAMAMADLVPKDSDRTILELGGGTGAITQALLDRGIRPERLIVIEIDKVLHQHLARRFPQVRILRGDATEMASLLQPLGIAQVGAIVSGLPLLGMRQATQDKIIEQCTSLLAPDAPLIQFTYGLFSPIARRRFAIDGTVRRRVLNNMPPANIWVYRRRTVAASAA